MEDKSRIIVVEDDKAINELVTYNLRRQGYCVMQAFDGIEAKIYLKTGQFDIVILDIMLPGIDGFDICRDIKQPDKSSARFVIVITAKSNPQDKLYAHILGADCYLTKPFSVAKLLSVVKEFDNLLHKKFVVKTR